MLGEFGKNETYQAGRMDGKKVESGLMSGFQLL